MISKRPTASACWLCFSALLTLWVPSVSPAQGVDYERDIKPLLRNKCVVCHGPVKQESGLRLDAGKLVLIGGDGGKIVVPGNRAESELIDRVTTSDSDLRMPPEAAPLSAAQVELLRSWIDSGAMFPADEVIKPMPSEHWAFQPIRKVPVPETKDKAWPINAIDHFVLAKLERRGWRPSVQAEPHALLRRVYLDLIGLPPTIEEQDAFLQAPTREAYDHLILQLLDRDAYGERNARHWLDVVRYADSNGYERDAEKPEVWRYRDYVIRSLNNDKPFDRFVMEQLAGDELPDADQETTIATGFNRLGPWDDEPADFDVDRFDQLNDLVNTTGQTFLGLTVGCARCHDHKFDPLTARDYYSLVAVFNPLKRPQSGRTELTRYAAAPLKARELDARDEQIKVLQSEIATLRSDFQRAFFESGKSELHSEITAVFQIDPAKRSPEEKKIVEENQGKLDAELDAVLPEDVRRQVVERGTEIATLRKRFPDVPRAYFMHEASPQAPQTRILLRGNPSSPGDTVQPAVPAFLVKQQPEFLAPDEFTTRRRLSLARWIADDANPLTPRVIVNRVWQWHFGAGLVRTPNDFGLIGEPPTHPALLDFLADWFVHQADGSLKKLHHLVLSSRTYQMSRDRNDAQAQADPENRLLWRQSYRRLEVEAIRDSMLFVSGRLDRKMYGPPMHPFIPTDALLSHADKTSIWPAFDEQAASRRTIYAFIKRSLLVPMLEVLDLCDTTQTAPQREVTTVPTQALTLYNGDFVNRQAAHLAQRLNDDVGDRLDDQIRYAWRLAFCRLPSESEQSAMQEFFTKEVNTLRQAAGKDVPDAEIRRRALVQICRVLLNLNEFVYPD